MERPTARRRASRDDTKAPDNAEAAALSNFHFCRGVERRKYQQILLEANSTRSRLGVQVDKVIWFRKLQKDDFFIFLSCQQMIAVLELPDSLKEGPDEVGMDACG